MIVLLLSIAAAAEPCALPFTAGRLEGEAALAADAWRAGDEATARAVAARVDGACVVDLLDVRAVGALAALLALARPEEPAWAGTAAELGGLSWPWIPGEPPAAGPAWLETSVEAGAWRVDGVPASEVALAAGRGHVLQRVAGGEVQTLLVTGPSGELTAALRGREPAVRSRVDITWDDEGGVQAAWVPSPARRPAIAAGTALLVTGGALLGGHFAAASAFERMEPANEAEIRRGTALTNGLLLGAAAAGVAGVSTLGLGVGVAAGGGLGVGGRW